MEKLRPDLQYHSKSQEVIFLDSHPRVVVPAGRRFGKTQGAVNADIDLAISEPGSLQLWVDTTQANIEKYWEVYWKPILKSILAKGGCKYDKVHKVLTFWNGSIIYFGSAERPENLEGLAYRRITINEAGIILKGDKGRHLWISTLMPMTLLPGVRAQVLFIGTPKGLGLFRDFAKRGDDPEDKRWVVYRRTSYDNPLLPKAEIDELIDEMKKQGGERLVEQEIFAKFMEDDEGWPVIPFQVAEEALEREVEDDLTFWPVWACDPSGVGADEATLAKRRHNLFLEPVIARSDLTDGEMGAWWLKEQFDDTPTEDRPRRIVIDAAGVGQGWYTHARALGLPVLPVDWGKGAMDPKRFHRRRDELWFKFRERIEHMSLAGDVELMGELVKPLVDPKFHDERGIYKVESKDQMRRRLGAEGKSPNRADAAILTLAGGSELKSRRPERYRSVRRTKSSWMAA